MEADYLLLTTSAVLLTTCCCNLRAGARGLNLTPTPSLAPSLALALALALSLPLIEVHAELAQEEQKRAQWRLENSRRRHNYVPFIIRFLKTLADRGELTTHVEAAKKKRKHPA